MPSAPTWCLTKSSWEISPVLVWRRSSVSFPLPPVLWLATFAVESLEGSVRPSPRFVTHCLIYPQLETDEICLLAARRCASAAGSPGYPGWPSFPFWGPPGQLPQHNHGQPAASAGVSSTGCAQKVAIKGVPVVNQVIFIENSIYDVCINFFKKKMLIPFKIL